MIEWFPCAHQRMSTIDRIGKKYFTLNKLLKVIKVIISYSINVYFDVFFRTLLGDKINLTKIVNIEQKESLQKFGTYNCCEKKKYGILIYIYICCDISST